MIVPGGIGIEVRVGFIMGGHIEWALLMGRNLYIRAINNNKKNKKQLLSSHH